jgi:hypothetical protein
MDMIVCPFCWVKCPHHPGVYPSSRPMLIAEALPVHAEPFQSETGE